LVQQALNFFRQGNYRREISVCLTQIARANRRKGDYETALKALQEKLQLAQQGSQPQVAVSYGEIGAVLSEQERYPEALDQYDKALAINKPLGNRINLAYNQANRGDILWKLGRYAEAEQALSEAFAIANQPDSAYAQLALSQRRFPEATSKAGLALDRAGTQYKNVTIEAKYTLGLVKALTGSDREGKTLCEDAVKMATDSGDAGLLSRAMLVLAEAILESGDSQGALEKAMQVQARLTSGGQQESEWKAWLVAALANQRLGNKTAAQEKLVHAKNVLAQLQQKWGSEVFKLYLARPDVQVFYKQFD
jgi:tetratricopeptide (TPR) repeat protein